MAEELGHSVRSVKGGPEGGRSWGNFDPGLQTTCRSPKKASPHDQYFLYLIHGEHGLNCHSFYVGTLAFAYVTSYGALSGRRN